MYLDAFIDNAFNRNAASAHKIVDLFDHYLDELSGTTRAALIIPGAGIASFVTMKKAVSRGHRRAEKTKKSERLIDKQKEVQEQTIANGSAGAFEATEDVRDDEDGESDFRPSAEDSKY